MNIVAFIIGFLFGGIAVFVLRPKKDDNMKLAQYNALLAQQKQDIEKLRSDNLALVREAAENKKEAETLAGVREKMLNDFKVVSAELIEKQKESVVGTQKTVLGPMQDEMKALKDGFEKKISEILKTSTENKTSIDEQIKNMIAKSDSLQHEATNLANALKNKKTQGCWGETYLENILQMLGFVEGVDYVREEFSHVDDGKNIRPDFIVNLPNNKRIIINSKVSMESYLNYENAEDDALREKYANEFIAATQSHIDELSSKEYQKKVKDSGLDYVFMFMPLESAYILAMRKKPELYASAQKQNVALITSSLLFPMLKTLEMLLKLDRQSKNVAEVMDMVNKLYEKYCGFIDSFNSVGNSIESARKSYDNALKQLSEGKGNMSTWFDKIKDKSGITTNKKIAIEYKDE
ncbi:MAG: DNA recombination protein RmuC [Alphaproteobacteria bacterium]|nr:DNA recombination protein RmuC [Alphaproteobacteria bacterium]